ncbi:MAG TPA: hypothetical protein VKG24_09345 [Pseudolabrys sp.]|jgi:hypothetical protein|nr:hypothetical protein [Pseudolabrys sp.]
MPFWFARIACLIFVFLGSSIPAYNDDLADFNAAIEAVSAHNRVAIGYLRTGNTDLASLEIDRLRDAWSRFTERFSGGRPDAFEGNNLYNKLFTVVSAKLFGADLMLKTGRLDAARNGLDAIRGDFYDLRKASGVVVLADCVRDANTTMDALMVYNDRALHWDKSEVRFDIASKAAKYGTDLDRCDNIANEVVRKAPEFRRLVDGSKASLALIPKAIDTRDTGLLHRLLIELRSYDNLLSFRYG